MFDRIGLGCLGGLQRAARGRNGPETPQNWAGIGQTYRLHSACLISPATMNLGDPP